MSHGGTGRDAAGTTTSTSADGAGTAPAAAARRSCDRWALPLAVLAVLVVAVANVQGLASGDDGVGYRATADSLLAGDGPGYFLERPLTVWPPLWPGLMAAVARLTPLGTMGAAALLNLVVTFLAVLVGFRLLRRVVDDDRLVVLGTLVIAVGPATVGLGHLLMTDFAFAVVVMAWVLALANQRDRDSTAWLVAAALLVWLGFGLRYVGVVLIGTGGLWLLLDLRRPLTRRLGTAALYGAVSVLAPLAWMLRNHATDGTFTGQRWPSARGLALNAFDVVATTGRFLLPGVFNGRAAPWATVAVLVGIAAVVLGWRVLSARAAQEGAASPARFGLHLLGGTLGLLLLHVLAYLGYMLYVRTTTALNRLDLRLLFPAYFPIVVLGLALVARLRLLDGEGSTTWARRGRTVAGVWAGANVLVGLTAMVLFAGGASFDDGDYESDAFDAVRASPALDALPEDCDVVSNLPNALYPAVESRWSPRRNAPESSLQLNDLEELIPTLDTDPTCLVWVDLKPVYTDLWPLEDLRARLDLQELARQGDVAVYRMRAPS